MSNFREKNPVVIGGVSIMVILLVCAAAFYSKDLPIIGGGTTYLAEFSEAGGIRPNDEVRVAGVKVGEVRSVKLDGDHVDVAFRVRDAWLGDKTSAAINIKTLLGQKYLAVDPRGTDTLSPGTPIPRERTTAPYDVTLAFSDLSKTLDQVDSKQLAASFKVLSETFKDTPESVRSSLDGLSRISQTISSKDEQLATLLKGTNQVSGTLAERNQDFEKLLKDGNLLLKELQNRKAAISKLLDGVKALSVQLQGLVVEDQALLKQALAQLDRVTDVLYKNQENLARSIQASAPFTRVVANVLGNGRWFDSYICGLLPPSAGPIAPEGCDPR
ncbi:MCE family protein [Pseudonocardiaceae bacterium YIM PH 21723]|nr:MCE family protein [Pseudonocardiaceae bacterium YIM PH 21723]